MVGIEEVEEVGRSARRVAILTGSKRAWRVRTFLKSGGQDWDGARWNSIASTYHASSIPFVVITMT